MRYYKITGYKPSDFEVIDFSDFIDKEKILITEIATLTPTPAEVHHIESEIKKLTKFIEGVKT
jgi:SepF-like predicted cell division protein (DUF552 family)